MDKISGRKTRPELDKVIERIGPDDEICVLTISHLASSISDIADILEIIEMKGSVLVCLAENEPKSSENLVRIIRYVTTIDDKIRAMDSKQKTAKYGVKRSVGRPAVVSHSDAAEWIDNQTDWRTIASWYGISRSSAFKLKKTVIKRE